MVDAITSNQVQTADHFNTAGSSVTSLDCLLMVLSTCHAFVVEVWLL